MTLEAILVGLLVAILADELLGWIPWLAKVLLKHNARRLPIELQERYKEEWLSHLNDIPGRAIYPRIINGT